jgi:hypothetical protein
MTSQLLRSARRIAHHRAAEYVLLAIGLCGAAAFVTWPHARLFTSHVVSHIDPLLSMWRVAWFSHAIAHGQPLWHGNIFYPEPFTYLLSDATLLQGALAAPALWLGARLHVVYNSLLLLGIVSSGVAIYWLATGFGIARSAAVFAAIVFALAPYRIEHIMHLELQWAAFAVVAFGALYQVLYAPQWKSGVALGLSVWLQFLASVYYAVFLLPILIVLAAASIGTWPDRRRTVRVGVVAVALCGALTLPIASIYANQKTRVGPRPIGDIISYSATPSSYLATPESNTLYGRTADRLGSGEKRLFPGTLALLLAGIGLFSSRRRVVVAALIVVLLSVDLSFGVNGLLYPRLLDWWPHLDGLRVPARYAVFVLAGVAVLAALGAERLIQRARFSNVAKPLILALAVVLACVEYRSPQRNLLQVDMNAPVYQFLRQLPEGVVLELPMPDHPGDPGFDADYMYWSTIHWRKLVNGYSGYYPASYGATVTRLRSLPDADAVKFVRRLGVRYVLVHLAYLDAKEGANLLEGLQARRELRWLGWYRDWAGQTAVFELIR